MSALGFSLALACAQPDRMTASMQINARPFPLLTRSIKGADRPIGNRREGIEQKSYPSERPSDALRTRRRRAHCEDKDGAEHQMDDESSGSLSRKIADHDFVAVDEQLERL